MAIKITGTTVINDSREFENLTDINNVIKKPSVTSPTDNETNVVFKGKGLTITGTPYLALSDNRDYREFQIDLSTGDFSSPVLSEQVNDDSFTTSDDPGFAFDTQHKVRIRDVDLDGNAGPFSDVVTFRTETDPAEDFIGTSSGDPVAGGFYMGTICAAGTCYYLVVAPNATGCACCKWNAPGDSPSGTCCSNTDGYANTYDGLSNSAHPAGNWTATRTIDGFVDWYLPAIDELVVFYANGGGGGGSALPAGEDFTTTTYHSSTCDGTGRGCIIFFNSGTIECGGGGVPPVRALRAVRRVPV